MTLKELTTLIETETTAADNATDIAGKALHEGRAQAFSFVLQTEIENRALALHMGMQSLYRVGTPQFIRAYNKSARAQGLPLLERGAAA